jgi:predicted acetyltransferase|tara:strand:+ start:346 stop:954 length:609 start_codon:yes stop_codon:yes gene_type:complete
MKTKFRKIYKKLNLKELNDIIFILRTENKSSILAKLSKKNIVKYLHEAVKTKDLELFIVTQKNIIGYAILACNPEYLLKNFAKFKKDFFIDLFLNLNFLVLFNIVISKLNFDKILISGKNKKVISESLNLNLLAIKRNYQSRGLGKKFLKYIFKSSIHKSKYITCETDNERSNNFYKKKLNFKSIGKRIRFLKLQTVLAKKL